MNARLDSLLNRWLDGELNPPEAAAVQQMLMDDPEARRAYYDLLLVDRLLTEQVEGKVPALGVIDELADGMALGRIRWSFSAHRLLAIAALVVLSLIAGALVLWENDASAGKFGGPVIVGSKDSRMTVAQRQDHSTWAVGELLRLERGTATIRLNPVVTANLEGPAAIERLDEDGNVRLLQGMASVEMNGAGGRFDLHVPGGVVSEMDARFTTEVLPDGVAHVRVESGLLEIRPRDTVEPIYLKKGDAIRLNADGTTLAIRLPNQHFRAGLPEPLVLFKDDFEADDGRQLKDHLPSIGLPWQVLGESNPTMILNRAIDTSSGARSLLASLVPHRAEGTRSVYIFSFRLRPPTRLDDKVERQNGVETISLVDTSGREILSVFAHAANGHRWQLRDDSSKAVTALTPVCSLWTHALTLCYGLDGRATLHDGSSAQAPVIAELHLEHPNAVSGISIRNQDGGDLSFDSMEATFLPVLPYEP